MLQDFRNGGWHFGTVTKAAAFNTSILHCSTCLSPSCRPGEPGAEPGGGHSRRPALEAVVISSLERMPSLLLLLPHQDRTGGINGKGMGLPARQAAPRCFPSPGLKLSVFQPRDEMISWNRELKLRLNTKMKAWTRTENQNQSTIQGE